MTIREPGRFIRLALMTVSPCFIASHSSAKNAEEWGTPLYTWFGVAAGIGGPPGELRSLESAFDFAQGRLGRLSPNGYRGGGSRVPRQFCHSALDPSRPDGRSG